MAKHIRAFIAAKIPGSSLLSRLMKELSALPVPLRVARPDTLHLTFKFLGDITYEDVPAITDVMEQVASRHQVIEAEVVGTGVFPTRERPRVAWAGFAPREPIQQLAYDLENELESLGFPRENKEFKPHLTLGRLKQSRPQPDLLQVIDKYAHTVFEECLIEELELIQSELEREGPTYTTLACVTLRDEG